MKKVLLLLSFLVAFFVSNAQYPVVQFLGRDSALVDSRGGMKARLVLYSYTDTASANLERISQYAGAIVYVNTTNSLWLRNATATGWSRIAAGGGGNGVSSLGTSDYGLTIQNDSTYKVDTSQVSTKLWRQKGIDSVQNNLTIGLGTKLNITDTANMRVRLYAGSNVTITGTYPNLTIASSGGGGGSQDLQGVTDLGDSTTNRLVTSDTVRTYWGVAKGNVTIGDSVPSLKTAIFFGHSVVANVGVTHYWQGFPYKVSTQYGWRWFNRGIAGTTVRHWSAGDSCLQDRLALIPTYSASTHSYLFFNYDINDANSSRGFDTTNYKVDYAKAIDTAIINRGWPASRVVILSANYVDTSVTNTYDNIRSFIRASRTVAEDKGIRHVDMFYPMEADGGSYYLADEDHPNVYGTTKIAEMIMKQLPEIQTVGELVVNGGMHIKDSARISGYLRLGDDTTGLSGGTTFKLMNTGTTYLSGKTYINTKADLGSNAWVNLYAQSSTPGLTVKDPTNAYINIHSDQIRIVNTSGNSGYYIADGITMGNGNFNFRGGGGTTHTYFGLYGGQIFNYGQTAGSNFQIKANTDANAFFVYGANDNIGSGTATPDASAKLELSSTTKGILIPRMTTTQRNAISSPAVGLMIYNTTDSAFNYYRLSGWSALGSGGGGTTYKIGTYNSQAGSVNGAVIVSDSIYMQAFSSENPGLVPAGGSGTTYLRGDGTWQTISGGTGYVDSVSNNAGGDSLIVIKGSNRYAYVYPAGGASGITIGTTAITSGTSRHILFDSSGVVKENSYLQFNTSNQLLLRGGSPGASTPSIAAVNATSTGIELHDATNGVSINVNGTREIAFTQTELRGDNSMVFGWNNSASGAYGGSRNVGITYSADKTIKVVDATTGNGSLQAYLRPYAGSATAGTSPLKFTSGTNMTAAEAGAVEYNGTNFFVTPGTAVRETVVTDVNTVTLTNKRVTPRVATTASSSSLTINSDNSERYTVTALAADMTINNPSGTPTDGQTLLIRIKDDGTARALTWSGSQFRVIGVTLPTTTVISKTVYIGLIWNSADSKWDVVSVNQEA